MGVFAIGTIADKYENGGRGPTTIGRTKGDHGGASYGRYQLASNTGTLQRFLDHAGEKGYPRVASAEFDKWWVANADRLDEEAHEFILATHYEPLRKAVQFAALGKTGYALEWAERSTPTATGAMEELIFSTAVQYGPSTKVLSLALEDTVYPEATCEDMLVAQLCHYKFKTVHRYFKSSSQAVQRGQQGRYVREWADYMAYLGWEGPAPLARIYRPSVYGKTAGGWTEQYATADGMIHLIAGARDVEVPQGERVTWYQTNVIPYDGLGFAVDDKVGQHTALNILATSMYYTSIGKMGIGAK